MTLIPLTVGTHNQMDEINRLMLEQNKVNAQWREENLATTTDPSNRGEFIHPSMIQEDPNYWPVWLQNPAAGAYLTGFGWLGSWLSRNKYKRIYHLTWKRGIRYTSSCYSSSYKSKEM